MRKILPNVNRVMNGLSNQASHDILTGLVNRREFERRTECLLETIQQDKGLMHCVHGPRSVQGGQ